MGRALSRRALMGGAVASAAALTFLRAKTTAAKPMIHEVRITSFTFEPEHLEVSVGDIIRWTNEDLPPHTATALEFGWDTAEIEKGASAEVTVTEGMETAYFCVFHPHMTGTLSIS